MISEYQAVSSQTTHILNSLGTTIFVLFPHHHSKEKTRKISNKTHQIIENRIIFCLFIVKF